LRNRSGDDEKVTDVRVVAGTAHAAAAALNATATITVGGIVQAAAEVVRAPETTLADLQALAATLQATLREAERLRASIAADTESPGRATAMYRWTVAGSLAGLISALIALLAYVQATIKDTRPDPAPSITVSVEQPPGPTIIVQPDRAPVDRTDDGHLQERVQHGHDGDAPGAHREDRRGADR
jgi:hypothetical protein